MPSTPSLLPRLTADFPTILFTESTDFHWSPSEHTVYYKNDDEVAQLFHELSHGLLGHADYTHDVDLLKMERDAWDKARDIAPTYDVTIDDDTVQAHLDTYRDWLHARSTCPNCTAIGHQIRKQIYHCSACGNEWRVNEARICGLKRYNTKKRP